MSHTASRQAQQLPRSHPRNRPAEQRSRGTGSGRRQKRPHPIPGWLYLLAGLGAGMLVTSLVKLSDVPAPAQNQTVTTVAPQPVAVPRPAPEVKTAPAPAEPAPPVETASETRFDFYTLLPEREVIVPDQRTVSTPAAPAATSSTTPATATTGAAAPALPAPAPAASAGEAYLLQAGSFRGSAEAERRRAQIQALGLTARIESVAANGDTWYRVQAGPFTSADTLTDARSRLSGAGIETLLLRRRPPQ